jgi:type IV pilus assembly protein PilA
MTTMRNKRFKLLKNQKGMTLMELMAVVVILGILAAVAGTAVMRSFETARTNSDTASERIMEDAASRFLLDHPATATGTALTVAGLVTEGYLQNVPTRQSTGAAYVTVTATRTAAGAWTFTYQ